MITGTVPQPQTDRPYRFEDGVRVITGQPHMSESNESQRYIYIEPNHRWYYNTDTEEIRLRPDS